MAIIQCKICGGEIEIPSELTCGECPYCNSVTTFPKQTSDKKVQLYKRAEQLRHASSFDKAAATYEEIIKETPDDADAYWGLVLSNWGIEYVEDPITKERKPTCHRVQFESILSDVNYKLALDNAQPQEAEIYRKEAQRIAEIQKDILRISSQEKPFDIFICYKETDESGKRTRDSVMAQDIYNNLTEQGYKVFFSRITLEDKLGQEYEPYIFAALNSAKVMLVIGTKKEFFEAVWVKNEWSRFLSLKRKDKTKLLIPCYRDMDAYDLPEELTMLQSQNMEKIGFIQDILRGIDKVLSSPPKKQFVQEISHQPTNINNTDTQVSKKSEAQVSPIESNSLSKADIPIYIHEINIGFYITVVLLLVANLSILGCSPAYPFLYLCYFIAKGLLLKKIWKNISLFDTVNSNMKNYYIWIPFLTYLCFIPFCKRLTNYIIKQKIDVKNHLWLLFGVAIFISFLVGAMQIYDACLFFSGIGIFFVIKSIKNTTIKLLQKV